MRRTDDILSTIRMVQEEHLDVRTVTMGINLFDCATPTVELTCKKIRQKIRSAAGELVRVCNQSGSKYGIPIVNKRIAVSPVASIAARPGTAVRSEICHDLREAAAAGRQASSRWNAGSATSDATTTTTSPRTCSR